MASLKKENLIGTIICVALTVLGLIGCILKLTEKTDAINILAILILLFIAYYAVIGYKKPHGNLLKYVMLSYALYCMTSTLLAPVGADLFTKCMRALSAMIVVYISGRLDRINENKILTLVVLILRIYTSMVTIIVSIQPSKPLKFPWCIATLVGVIIWIDIMVAYYLRYRQHREAGLTDRSKNRQDAE